MRYKHKSLIRSFCVGFLYCWSRVSCSALQLNVSMLYIILVRWRCNLFSNGKFNFAENIGANSVNTVLFILFHLQIVWVRNISTVRIQTVFEIGCIIVVLIISWDIGRDHCHWKWFWFRFGMYYDLQNCYE